MFHVRKNRKIRTRSRYSECASGRISRRLRAELLENRMMLSASAPELAVSLPVGANEYGAVHYLFTASPVVLQNHIEEGGYVSSGSVTTNDTVSSNYSGGAPTIGDLLSSGSTFDSFDYDGMSGMTELLGNLGPVPRVIFFTTQHDSSQPIEPRITSQAEDSHEGGWISVMPNLDPNLPRGEANKDKSLLASAAADSLREPEADLGRSPENENSLSRISGEWARAVVFEIAGGEPAGETLAVREPAAEFIPASTSSSNAAAVESSSVEKSNLGEERPYEDNQVGRSVVDAAAAEAADNMAAMRERTNADVHSAFESADLIAQPRLGVAWYDRASRAGLLTPSSLPPADALAAAFDDFGDGEAASASSSPEYPRFDRWLNSTPLLLIFALERITSRRSRPRQARQTTWSAARRSQSRLEI
jgi:hypothetical protein